MRIVKDERETGVDGTCEHCGKTTTGRLVSGLDRFTGEIRRYWFLCFDCFGPRIFWRPRGKHAKVYESPASILERTSNPQQTERG